MHSTGTSPKRRKVRLSPEVRRKKSELAKKMNRDGTFRANRWKKGQSGNPGGVPKKFIELCALARTFTVDAVNTLGDLMYNAEDEKVRAYCADMLLDRGWGKAPQALIARVMGDDTDDQKTQQLLEHLPEERRQRAKDIAAVLVEIGLTKQRTDEEVLTEVEVVNHSSNGNGDNGQHG